MRPYFGGNAEGFEVGSGNRIDSTNALASGAGYAIRGDSNLIIRNSARRSGRIAGVNNTIGAVMDMSLSGGTITAGSSWSNFVY